MTEPQGSEGQRIAQRIVAQHACDNATCDALVELIAAALDNERSLLAVAETELRNCRGALDRMCDENRDQREALRVAEETITRLRKQNHDAAKQRDAECGKHLHELNRRKECDRYAIQILGALTFDANGYAMNSYSLAQQMAVSNTIRDFQDRLADSERKREEAETCQGCIHLIAENALLRRVAAAADKCVRLNDDELVEALNALAAAPKGKE